MFYAARIEAARRGATPALIVAAIRAIVNEKIVALRNLANRRRQAATDAKAPPSRPVSQRGTAPVRRAQK